MRKIYLLTDYKGRFGSKYNDSPYRSGMDKELLTQYFLEHGFKTIFTPFQDIRFRAGDFKDQPVIYTSAEDGQYHYKSFIEDIVYGLELSGAFLIPTYKFLRANNNKIFMEILRDLSENQKDVGSIYSRYYGTYEELKKDIDHTSFDFPVVLKPAGGAMSRGVSLAKNNEELSGQGKKLSATKDWYYDLRDFIRFQKHKGYVRESSHRKKFIVQNFIPGLNNDYKVLVFDNKYYVLKRRNRKDDFRASGGGLLSYEENLPEGLLDFAEKVFRSLDLPHVSLDLAFDGNRYHLFEFQAIYFGSYTLTYSDFYFEKQGTGWLIKRGKSVLEEEFVNSIVSYIQRKRFLK